MTIPEDVRRHCAAVASAARHVAIDPHATSATGGIAGLDPHEHPLDGDPEDVARYVLILDALNFGSGWFPTLRHGSTPELTRRLTADVRARGGTPWTASELRAATPYAIAAVLDEDAAHPLMALYADGLRQLGAFLGDRGALEVIGAAQGSAARLARTLAEAMPFFADHGFYKRAQITANDLVLAGVASFGDIDDLTVFADNFLPHVLRLDGVLVLEDALAARIDAGALLEPGSDDEVELRACAVHACELLAARQGVAPRVLDNWLWNRALEPRYAARPAHRTRTLFY